MRFLVFNKHFACASRFQTVFFVFSLYFLPVTVMVVLFLFVIFICGFKPHLRSFELPLYLDHVLSHSFLSVFQLQAFRAKHLFDVKD